MLFALSDALGGRDVVGRLLERQAAMQPEEEDLTARQKEYQEYRLKRDMLQYFKDKISATNSKKKGAAESDYISEAGDVAAETAQKNEGAPPRKKGAAAAKTGGGEKEMTAKELKAEGDWDVLEKYSGFVFDDAAPKAAARTKYENMLYLERPGCSLCMGNQEKAEAGDTVMATSTRLFQGRVVRDTDEKKGESLLSSTPVVVLSTILGRTPTMAEYEAAVDGIVLTKFKPSEKQLVM